MLTLSALPTMLSVNGLSCLLLLFDALISNSYTSASRISNERPEEMNPPATGKPVFMQFEVIGRIARTMVNGRIAVNYLI